MDSLSGSIKKIIYYKEDTGYTVASFLISDKDLNFVIEKTSSLNDSIIIVGSMPRKPIEDEEYKLTGEFVTHSTYGMQFKFNKVERCGLDTSVGIINYLSSDIFPGIGQKKALMICTKLGNDCLTKIKKDPFVLDKLKLTNKEKDIIIKGITVDKEIENTLVFLMNNYVTLETSNKIINSLKKNNFNNYIDEIKKNPYMLISIVERFGFKKADSLALSIGIKKDSEVRVKALLQYVLNELLNSTGDSYVLYDDFYHHVNKVVDNELDINIFNKYLYEEHDAKHLYVEESTKRIFNYYSYLNEIDLAKSLSHLLKNNNIEKYSTKNIDECFNQIEKQFDINYNKEQVIAIKKAFTEPIVIITGGPGTGKTTIIHAILQIYFKLNNDNNNLIDKIALLAPTGRASRRLNEATSMPSSTIHRFLGYDGYSFEYNKYNKTSARLIIVDEASMMDTDLASTLITSMNDYARIIIVGDVDQLPSVGPGQVLKDLIDSKEITTVRLTKIHRQAENSSIIKLAHSINEGIIPEDILEKLDDRTFINIKNTSLLQGVVDVYDKALKSGIKINDLQILIPMYKVGCGINDVNLAIQDLVNPINDLGEYKTGLKRFRINDKVIQLINRTDKQIMNGDIGYIKNFLYKKDSDIINGLVVSFDLLQVEYTIEELEELSLAYAISIHKSQGSEFKCVIIPFDSHHFIMLEKKLIYTAITRCKEKLIMMGDINVLKRGITKIKNDRNTILKEHFIDSFNPKGISIKEYLNKIDNKTEEINDIEFEEIDL